MRRLMVEAEAGLRAVEVHDLLLKDFFNACMLAVANLRHGLRVSDAPFEVFWKKIRVIKLPLTLNLETCV